jgi:Rrf2 family protein
MAISSKSRYAVRALAELAALETRAEGRPVPLAEIAGRRDIPQQFLEQVFGTLRRARIVQSRRGASGGYRFARPPSDVTVLAVVTALDGAPSPAECTQGLCERADGCGAASVWIEAKEAFEAVLERTTIADLVEREAGARRGPAMYYI